MSKEYDKYLSEHIGNTIRAYQWIKRHLPELLIGDYDYESQIRAHDLSKYSDEEYHAYDNYFYGTKTDKVKSDFNYAWNHHMHVNKHHYEYWIIPHDNKDGSDLVLDMPYNYIIEMICDQFSFSFKAGNLYEIFNWYKENDHKIVYSKNTWKIVKHILKSIKKELDSDK